jgi:hypothetical protein
MTTTTKSLLAIQMGVRYGITDQTAWLFMHQLSAAMKSIGNNRIDGIVPVLNL